MSASQLLQLLETVRAGALSASDAAQVIERLRPAETAYTGSAAVDLARSHRCGFAEVVYSPGKTPAAIVEIFDVLHTHGQPCLATLVSSEQAAAILARFPLAQHNSVARTVRMARPAIPGGPAENARGRVVVVTAGTSDLPIAEEAVETLRWMECPVELIVDVGVAGPQRLWEQRPRLLGAEAIVVVAGMEGALPSVVGGHVDCPVIAVPTSIGYGASFGGVAALLGMLNSCASNVTVVNIDSGFKGGYIAGLIARRVMAARNESSERGPPHDGTSSAAHRS